jgi:hypothetical protein
MEYSIYGDNVTIDPGVRHIGGIFEFTGKNLTRLGLPNDFFFQLPDKFAFHVEENINQDDQLINTLPITNGMCVLLKYLRECIQNWVSSPILVDRNLRF